MTGKNEVSGKAKGGIARAKSLSPEMRSEIARKAATARWNDELTEAVCGSPDSPLRIGDIEIECYVLEDGTSVLTQATFLEALGRHRKANVRREGEEQVPAILQGKALKPFITAEVLEKSRPISFRLPTGGRASGYNAENQDAPHAGALPLDRSHAANRCDTTGRHVQVRSGVFRQQVWRRRNRRQTRVRPYLADLEPGYARTSSRKPLPSSISSFPPSARWSSMNFSFTIACWSAAASVTPFRLAISCRASAVWSGSSTSYCWPLISMVTFTDSHAPS